MQDKTSLFLRIVSQSKTDNKTSLSTVFYISQIKFLDMPWSSSWWKSQSWNMTRESPNCLETWLSFPGIIMQLSRCQQRKRKDKVLWTKAILYINLLIRMIHTLEEIHQIQDWKRGNDKCQLFHDIFTQRERNLSYSYTFTAYLSYLRLRFSLFSLFADLSS